MSQEELDRQRLSNSLREYLGQDADFTVRKMTPEERESFKQEQRIEKFHAVKIRGIRRGLLISLLLSLSFIPLFPISSQEMLAVDTNQGIEYIPMFIDIFRILLMIFFEVGLIMGLSKINLNLHDLKKVEKINQQQEVEIISYYTWKVLLNIALPVGVIFIVNTFVDVANLFLETK